MTRSGKKRNRSKSSPPEQEATTKTKKKKLNKSVKDFLTENTSTEEMSSPTLPLGSTKLNSSTEATVPHGTSPREKLVFDDIPTSADTPAWAKDLIKSVNDLKRELSRVCSIAESTQQSITGIMDKSTELSSKLSSYSKKVIAIERDNTALKIENTDLKERLLLLEFHQRRNNLIFEGIEEEIEDKFESGFDCYQKIMACLSCIPDLDTQCIRIDRCHRLGPRVQYRNRGIIAKINWYGDLVEILRGRSHLPRGVTVHEDLPEEWNERRRLLRPILARAKEIPKFKDSSFLSRDKLIINGVQYTVSPVNNLCELPLEIKPSDTCEKKNETTIAFFGPHSVFSNFHPAAFTDNHVRYSCSEQMIQAEKAALFGDKTTLQRIMKEKDPYKIKGLGTRVKGFKREVWVDECRSIAVRAVKAKFHQNVNLGKLLRCMGSALIVEASKDRMWGTGVHLRDRNALARDHWFGNGMMSEILSEVRKSLDGKA